MTRLYLKLAAASLCLALGSGINPAALSASPAASTSVPLNSYVYEYLEKLDGLGYLEAMRTGNKPYTRSQISDWLRGISEKAKQQPNTPAYVKQMLLRLEKDFAKDGSQFGLRNLRLTGAHYSGDTLSYRPNSVVAQYQPLSVNNNGFKYSPNGNGILSAAFEGELDNRFVLALTPRLSASSHQSEAELETGYLKFAIRNTEVLMGRNELWWGQGTRGTLALTNNAVPFTGIKFSNIKPITPAPILKFLGPSHLSFLYAPMEKNRSDVNSPSFVAMRADFQPDRNFTFGAARTSIVGGNGHGLSHSDYWDFLLGTNAGTAAEDKWNSIAGFDFRWRLPNARGAQFYGEIYGEDQAKMLIIPGPSQVAGLAGLYIPRLSKDGSWDAQLEWAQTGTPWYVHSLYRDGYVYRGNIIGDSMGTNAQRLYAKVGHYLPSAASVSLNYEHIVQNRTANFPQTIDSLWLSAQKQIDEDSHLILNVGFAKIANPGFQAGPSENSHLVSMTFVQSY